MGTTRRAVLRTVVALAMAGAITMPLWSCGHTLGESIQLRTGVMGTTATGGSPASFVNRRGWQVDLTEAYVVIGPIYFYEAAPQAHWLDGVVGLRQAHAHLVVSRGTVLGEVLQQHVIDLLSGAVHDTGTWSGVAGQCQSAEVQLLPPGEHELGPTSHAIELVRGHTIWLSGVAAKDGVTIPFEGGLTLPDEGKLRLIEDIAGTMDLQDASESPGAAVVLIYVDEWLGNVNFDTLPEPAGEGPRVLAEGSQAYTAWQSGVRSRFSYGTIWKE